MSYGGDRYSRRSRTKTAQSCEMVGLLPAEEIALKRALTASLTSSTIVRTKAKDRIITISDDSDEDGFPREQPAHGNREKMGTSSSNSFSVTAASGMVGTGRESSFRNPSSLSLRRLPLRRLTSPTFSDEDSSSSMAPSSSISVPASPPVSNRSPPSLHLYVSSSSSEFSESEERSTSPEWRPGEVEVGGKKKAVRLKKKKLKGKTTKGKVYHSKKLVRSGKDDHVLPKKLKRMEELGRAGDDVAMATTQSLSSKCMMAVEEEEKKKEVEGGGGGRGRWQHRAQRKFASNHLPPVRYLPSESVKECKKLPKTEDFITYLCLRGSGDVPNHLQKFASPWTPRPRRGKLRKNKVKGQKGRLLPSSSKKTHPRLDT